MRQNILRRNTSQLSFWGPKWDYSKVVNRKCPLTLTWDNYYTFDSSCKIFDTSGGEFSFSTSFDTDDFIFSSTTQQMDSA